MTYFLNLEFAVGGLTVIGWAAFFVFRTKPSKDEPL